MGEIIRGFRVVGKVQGVYFRHSTRIEAERLGVRGSACNLADGSVEVILQGEEADVLALAAWLKIGPTEARVHAVEELQPDAEVAAKLPQNFQVR